MNDRAQVVRCRECRFWQDNSRLCRRLAPSTADKPNVVTRWPETKPNDGCGEGDHRPQETARAVTNCASCAFWDRPGQGIDPPSRGDRLSSWWREAGYCRRRSPAPGTEIGLEAFWCATNGGDFCFEGQSA